VLVPLFFAVFVRNINVNDEGILSALTSFSSLPPSIFSSLLPYSLPLPLGQTEKGESTKEPPWIIVKEVLTTKSFWKYILLATLVANVRALFRYHFHEHHFISPPSSSPLLSHETPYILTVI